MKDSKLQLVWKAQGYLDAQLIKNYLESFGIEVFDFEESVGKAYGLTVGSLGEVELYVRKEKRAKRKNTCGVIWKSSRMMRRVESLSDSTQFDNLPMNQYPAPGARPANPPN